MKKIYYWISVLLLIQYSCLDNHNASNVEIRIEQDTVKLDETFIANLHLVNYENELPEFFIIRNNDTVRLVFNDSTKSAHFEAASQNSGNKTYKGFVQYNDSLGRFKKENFTINFFVK